mgnify:FL=1
MNGDGFFILLTISFFLVWIVSAYYWSYASLLVLGSIKYRYASQYLRLENALTQRVSMITFLIMIINISLFINLKQSVISVNSFFEILLYIFLYFSSKFLVIRFLGNIFLKKELAKLTVFFSFISDRSFAIIIFPFLVFVYFVPYDLDIYFVYMLILLSIIFMSLKIYSIYKIGTNSFGLIPLYIFLYLCILEIFPFVLVAKGFFY